MSQRPKDFKYADVPFLRNPRNGKNAGRGGIAKSKKAPKNQPTAESPTPPEIEDHRIESNTTSEAPEQAEATAQSPTESVPPQLPSTDIASELPATGMPTSDHTSRVVSEARLQKDLAAKEAESADLYEKLTERDGKIEELENLLKTLREQYEKLSQEQSNQKSDAKDTIQAFTDLRSELDAVTEDRDYNKILLQAEKSHVKDLEQAASRLESDLEDKRKALTKVKEQFDDEHALCQSLHAEVDRLEQEQMQASNANEGQDDAQAYLRTINEAFAEVFEDMGLDLTPENFANFSRDLHNQQPVPRRPSEQSLASQPARSISRPGALRNRQVSIKDELKDYNSDEEAISEGGEEEQAEGDVAQTAKSEPKQNNANQKNGEAKPEIDPDFGRIHNGWQPDYEGHNAIQQDVTDHGPAGDGLFVHEEDMRSKSTQTGRLPASPPAKEVSLAIQGTQTSPRLEGASAAVRKRTGNIEAENAVLRAALGDAQLPRSATRKSTGAKTPMTLSYINSQRVTPDPDFSAIDALENAQEIISDMKFEARRLKDRIALKERMIKDLTNPPNGQPLVRTIVKPGKTSYILRPCTHTFVDIFNRSPWWMKLIYIIMFFMWTSLTIAAYQERSLWLAANDDTYSSLRVLEQSGGFSWGIKSWIEDAIGFDRSLLG